MSESIGPRTYLVGQILPALIQKAEIKDPTLVWMKEIAEHAVKIADHALDRMQWPDGKPC